MICSWRLCLLLVWWFVSLLFLAALGTVFELLVVLVLFDFVVLLVLLCLEVLVVLWLYCFSIFWCSFLSLKVFVLSVLGACAFLLVLWFVSLLFLVALVQCLSSW